MSAVARLDPRRLSLRWQLSLAIVLVLTLTLAIAISIVLRNARNAVADELQASLDSTGSSLDATLLLLTRIRADEVEGALGEWLTAHRDSRHLCVTLSVGRTPAAAPGCARDAGVALSAPRWFARGVTDAPHRERRQLAVDGRLYTVWLLADPREELNESWDETRELLQLMVLMAFAVNALILLLVTRALRPLDAATAALARLHDGDFALPAPQPSQARDLRQLLLGIDRLAQKLARSADENRRLLLQNLDVAEEERRLIARELHDEVGQHVTAIEIATIGREGTPDTLRIRESVAEIHQLSRRMIRRLRPAALDTLGLAGGLQALLSHWQTSQPQMAVIDEIDPLCDRLDAYTATHVYRIVQEALSNAVRHARAERVQVQLMIVNQEIRLRVADDGHGFDPQTQTAGLGLMGLRERVKALGGQLDIITGRHAGCRLQIRLPTPLPPRSRAALVP